MFFGRKEDLAEIIELRIKQSCPISTILIGGRKIGKTSLLYQIQDRLLKQLHGGSDTIISTYIDLQAVVPCDRSTFFRDLAAAIARSVQRQGGILVSVPESLAGDPYSTFCQQVWAIFDQCAEHIDSVRFVLLIDETEQLLGHPWTEDVVSNLRHLINTSDLQPFVTLVVAGFKEVHDYAMVEEGIGSRFGDAVYWTKLGVLTEKDARDLVTVPLGGVVREEVVRTVYELSGGHPFIIQYLMDEAYKPDPTDITAADVAEASRQFSRKVRVFSSWEGKFTNLDRQVYWALAQTGRALAPDAVQGLVTSRTELGATEDSLEFLTYTGVVAEQDGKYTAVGEMYRDWFARRHRKEPAAENHTKTQWIYKNAMNPELFIDQDNVEGFFQTLTRFASRFLIASERQDVLKGAGIDLDFVNSLNFNAIPHVFATSLLARLREYHVSEQRLNYHPMISLLSFLLGTGPGNYGLEDQDVDLCNRLIERGRENFRALQARNAVGRIESPRGSGIGTGVLVGKDLLLTCRHIFSKHLVQRAWVRFNYRSGRYEWEDDVFELDLAFVSAQNRPDYALVRIKGEPKQQFARPINRVLSSGHEIRIIHHPQGQHVVISGIGQIVQVGEAYIDHNLCTYEGSSGAPIFDQNWELIAIHRGCPGLGRNVPSGTIEGLPIYAIWDRISPHIA